MGHPVKSVYLFLFALATVSILLYGCGKDTSDENQIVLTTGFEEGELFYVGENAIFLKRRSTSRIWKTGTVGYTVRIS